MASIEDDIAQVSPETKVVRHQLAFKDPWDFEEVYAGLHEFASGYPFDAEAEDYLVHITTGTHVAQICWFLLAEARLVPGQLLQASPPKRSQIAARSCVSVGTRSLGLPRTSITASRTLVAMRQASCNCCSSWDESSAASRAAARAGSVRVVRSERTS